MSPKLTESQLKDGTSNWGSLFFTLNEQTGCLLPSDVVAKAI
ncbi:unnamed protein product, partial [marine sediment metagenome]